MRFAKNPRKADSRHPQRVLDWCLGSLGDAQRAVWSRLTVLAAALCMHGTGVAAQATPDHWADRNEPIFRMVASPSNREPGLPHTGDPTSLALDGMGFIWFGTQAGLERWDGYRIRTFNVHPGDSCALRSDYILSLLLDERKRFWVGMLDGGVARYDQETNCFEPVGAIADPLRTARVDALAADGSGGLWIGTASGLNHLSADLMHATRLSEDASPQGRLSREHVLRLLRDRHGALWVGTNQGLLRQGPSDSHFEAIALQAKAAGLSGVGALFESSDGRIWAGMRDGSAFVIDASTLRANAIAETLQDRHNRAISSIIETANAQIWLGTNGNGILIVDPVTFKTRSLRHRKGVPTSLANDYVEAMLHDRAGMLWIAGTNGIASIVDGGAVSTITIDDDFDANVHSMTSMGDDRIVAGVGDKIAVIGPPQLHQDPQPLKLSPPPALLASLATPDGRDLFVVVRPSGLVCVDPHNGRSYPVPLPGPGKERRLNPLFADNGQLWVGGYDGIWLVTRNHDGHGETPHPAAIAWTAVRKFDLRNVFSITAGPDAAMWFGTGDGLLRWDRKSAAPERIHLATAGGAQIADQFVSYLRFDRRGRLWVGTANQGLYVLEPPAEHTDRATVLRFLSSELPNPAIDSILEDRFGGIWVATDEGIAQIDAGTFAVRRLGRRDGLAIFAYWLGSSAVDRSGDLLFGGQGGITAIDPGRFRPPGAPPEIVVTQVSVGTHEVPSSRYNVSTGDPILEVPVGTQSLSVEFAALDYADPRQNSYAYRLDGYDREWMQAGIDNRIAAYTNLPSGNYRLHLRATNAAGAWSPVDRQISVRVAAAWYQTMWFHGLEGIAAILTTILIVHLRTVVLRAQQRDLELLVKDRTQALVRASEERKHLVENLAHDIQTPLTSLQGFLESLYLKSTPLPEAERDRFIGIALRQARRLNRLVRELFDLVRLDENVAPLKLDQFNVAELIQDIVQEFDSLADGRTIKLILVPGVEPVQFAGDINLIQRVIDNLLYNALQHTPEGGTITVKLAKEAERIVVEVSDTGAGIAPDFLERIFDRYERGRSDRTSGAGLGLAIVRKIVELHGGSIRADSQVGLGTRFTVLLPLGQAQRQQ
jgi:signal transduction histidine kinase/ligand-binding sensor domain-containing protein